jgi:hypothetical protein
MTWHWPYYPGAGGDGTPAPSGDGIPVLSVTVMRAHAGVGRTMPVPPPQRPGWFFSRGDVWRVRLDIVSGTLRPGDKVFILRRSYSGRKRFRVHKAGRHDDADSLIGWSAKTGFRHPYSPYGGYASAQTPHWGAFGPTEWNPEFYRPGGPDGTVGTSMELWLPFREIMRYKDQHAARAGVERLKFVIARPLPPPTWGHAWFRQWQYGACLETIVLRLHNHQPVGAANRPMSLVVRS